MTEPRRFKPADLVAPEVLAHAAYHVPDPGSLIKLNAMENPYDWPPELVEEWLRRLRDVGVNRYPDAGASALKQQLRAQFDIDENFPIVLGNGSDELIQLIIMTLRGPHCTVLSPEPGFVMYKNSSLALGARYLPVALTPEDFSLGHNVIIDAIDQHRPAVVFIAYPNNPTGNLFDRRVVDAVIEAAPGLVVVDEAYSPFARTSYLDAIAKHSNLLVMRTLSKLGLAGLRLGFLAGPAEWLGEMEKLRLPYNVNVLTQVSAEFALRHRRVFDAQSERIIGHREQLYGRLSAIAGVSVYPSAANFLLFKVAPGRAAEVFDGLCDRGVLIKNLSGSHPHLEDCLRVTVGTSQQNFAFLEALSATVQSLA